jgi:hypothetical protein
MTRNAKMITGVGIGAALGLAGLGALLSNSPAQAGGAAGARPDGNPVVTVYRSPTCGCCKGWEDHMRENGFTIESIETSALDAVKAEHGVPRPLQSCHTALVDGYVIEGHVPAEDIARLLRERPDVRGLAVPGMPSGSPGMESPGRAAQPYEVFAFDDAGAASEVWAVH